MTNAPKRDPVPAQAGSQADHVSRAVSTHIETARLGDLEERLASERERYLRLAADFDNFKKRTARETERRALKLKDTFIESLLPVVDNLERALKGSSVSTPAAFHEGVGMTLRQLTDLLREHGIEPEDSLGQLFDPHRHEAVCTRANPDFEDQTVLEVWQRGWRRGSEVFRPAKVVVNDLGHFALRDRTA